MYRRQKFIYVITKEEIGIVKRTEERTVARKHDMDIYLE
jgi:hypothetical protein